MNILIYLSLFLQFYFILIKAQRIAPGVPPQHYQQQQYQPTPQQQQYQQAPQQQQQQYQQVPQQQYGQQAQYQQVPVQQQQIPQQQQQVPLQQQQQQVPVQHQVPVQQQAPVQQQVPVQPQVPVLQQVPGQHQIEIDKLPAHQRQAIRQGHVLNTANVVDEAKHIAEHMDVPIDTSKMTEQELQFHYFKMHDADNNNKLDGCELIKSLIHWHEQGSKEKQGAVEEKLFKDEELINLIDPILNVDDYNQDGYIDYPEFIRAQQKAVGQTKPQA